MATPRSPEARRFYVVARQRLDDAAYLLRGGRNNAAVYLAGYAVECMLKSLLIQVVPRKQQAGVAATFHGRDAHSYELLLLRYRDSGGPPFPRQWGRAFARVGSWSTDLRYTPGIIRVSEVTAFLEDVRTVVDGIDGRL